MSGRATEQRKNQEEEQIAQEEIASSRPSLVIA